MKKSSYIVILFLLLQNCSQYQKALNTDEVSVKYNMGDELFENKKYNKASRLFSQILPQYRGKPQAQKLTYMQAMCLYNLKDYSGSSYLMERFVNSYPESEKLEEMAFFSAKSYYLMAPEFSKDSNDIIVAIDKLQYFINTYPESTFIENANNLIFDLEFRLEQKDFNIALQYNRLSDYQAAIKSFENFLVDFPGSSLREKAMYYRFDSAYNLAVNSVKWKQPERIVKTLNYYNSFKLNYVESDFLNEMDSKMSLLEKITNN